MINKQITVTYPDQPYHTTTDLNNTFQLTYVGPRYILVQVDRDDFQAREAGRSDDLNDPAIDPAGYEQDDYYYTLLDAESSDDACLYAAYMTDEYTHPDIADYTEECTDADGNTWTFDHVYEGTTGMLPHIYWTESLLYYPESDTWRAPQFREHVNSRESVVEVAERDARAIKRALADSNQSFTAEDRTTLSDYADWLASVDTLYAGINHWKWPYPEDPIPEFIDPAPEDLDED